MDPLNFAQGSDGKPAGALPLGRTEATRRYLADAARRNARLENSRDDPNALGIDGLMDLLFDFGLMSETMRPIRVAGPLCECGFSTGDLCAHE